MLDPRMSARPSLDDLIALALAAGREILAVRDAGFDAEKKLDGSLVTIADQRAEALIEARLAELCPGVPMLGEEATAAGRLTDTSAKFFCVDALDGTKGFVRGGDEFTVNIALIENTAPIMGVVFAPASGELYAGEPGRALGGGFDGRTSAETQPLHAISCLPGKPATGWRVIASDYSGRGKTTRYFGDALGPHTTTHASSSIKFCKLAEGAADLYPRFGEVSEWDTAAGHAVLAAAGGGVMRPDGEPLTYGARPMDFRVRGFVAYANAAAKAAALDGLARMKRE